MTPSGGPNDMRMLMKSNLPIILLLSLSLVAAGATRGFAQQRRLAMVPEALAVGKAAGTGNIGQLNSFALGLLLGGLRGPLVMVLWSSSEGQRNQRDFEDFDTKVELIRLLQPQFDSVHLYQIWNKAYNVSVERANLASKYAAILDALDYGQRVIRERPANIDLETYLGEIYNNKLGGSYEADYFKLRIHEETQADQPVVKITFSIGREAEFAEASRHAGVSPRLLLVRRTEDPTKLMAAVRLDVAERLRARFSGEDVVYEQLSPRQVGARGVSGPLRLEPMLDERGNLLPSLTTPTRLPPPGREEGTYLDGSSAQFLREFAPFPEGVSPHALAYNHFMNGYVLQTYGGQRHVQYSAVSVAANPGRALRSWAFSAYEEGRLLEAEAFDRNVSPPGNDEFRQAELEREVADVGLDAEPTSTELLHQAIHRYERSAKVSAAARQWLQEHLEQYPESSSVFGSNIDRLRGLEPLLRADVLYLRLLLGETDSPAAARREAERLYMEAGSAMIDFLLQHHTPAERLAPWARIEDLQWLPLDQKWEIIQVLRHERDMGERVADFVRTINEFEGYFDRIESRLSSLRAAS
jgi:hypothetical protein